MRIECHNAAVGMEIVAPVRKLCPFVDEVDDGTITIRWSTGYGQTLELHRLRAWLDTFATTKMTHESFTRDVTDELRTLFYGQEVDVVTTWTTAGMAVTVTG